ncbi:hypothetical protein [Bradyrhizobium glycinis]|uniref:hypothetical protein n=1 Tax=Bradyrhizobium glycinis TaxID=2751812 RepID=UPI001FE64634|nr:hypothetical protein [Bradyrhizobium glycinis]
MGIAEAQRLGIVDRVLAGNEPAREALVRLAAEAGSDPGFARRLSDKTRRREADEIEKPLQAYLDEELRRMGPNFCGFDPSYHVARYNFIHKVPKSRISLTIADHRSRRATKPHFVDKLALAARP